MCSYCETENEKVGVCSFCGADLGLERPKKKDYLSESDAYLSQPELAAFHTLDLCLLVRFLRKERSEAYHLMRTVQKGAQKAFVDEQTIQAGGELYQEATKRMRVIEGILIDRLGYKPKRIDDKLIASLQAKIARE
ncbi:hypothetical protein B0G66_1394 [Bacillus badius]|nr:hypothetical protein B0G66_1394 [Bacillus badius]